MNHAQAHPERARDLIIDRAVSGLAPVEEAELLALLDDVPAWEDEIARFEHAAGALGEALAPLDEPMPDALRRRVRAALPPPPAHEQADALALPAPTPVPTPAPHRRSPLTWTGWLAAAACVALGIAIAVNRSAPPPADPAGARLAFIAEHPGAQRAQWSPWALDGAPPERGGATGDVVWSEQDQAGYLRLVGLPPNDPAVEQYQLWIVDERGLFDPTGQSARISGAIFNADPDGETIVRIDPSIPVRNAGAFAVTIERPGGVWVSDMSRRTVIAALGG